MGLSVLDQGVRFECQGTGRCCTSRGEYGFVYLTDDDLRKLSAHLDLGRRELKSLHCGKTGGYWHLKDPDKDCQFLEGTRCGVYEARPHQCRTWPFWPENMDVRVWKEEIASFCPGIGKGRHYGPDEVRAILDSHEP